MSEDDIKQIIAQLSKLEGNVCSEIANLKDTNNNLRSDVKELFGKIDDINRRRPCAECDLSYRVDKLDVDFVDLEKIVNESSENKKLNKVLIGVNITMLVSLAVKWIAGVISK